MLKSVVLFLLIFKIVMYAWIDSLQIRYLNNYCETFSNGKYEKIFREKITMLKNEIVVMVIEGLTLFIFLVLNFHSMIFKLFNWMGVYFGCFVYGIILLVLELIFHLIISYIVMKEKMPLYKLYQGGKDGKEIGKAIGEEIGEAYAQDFWIIVLSVFVWVLPTPIGYLLFGISIFFFFHILPFFMGRYKTNKSIEKICDLEDSEICNDIQRISSVNDIKVGRIIVRDRDDKENASVSLNIANDIKIDKALVERYDKRIVEAVISHEMGHLKNKHTLKKAIIDIIVGAIISCVIVTLFSTAELYKQFGFTTNNVVFMLVVEQIILFPLYILLNIIKYYFLRKHEYEADEFAVSNGYAEEMKAFLTREKEYTDNIIVHPIYEAVYMDHPSDVNRVKKIENQRK